MKITYCSLQVCCVCLTSSNVNGQPCTTLHGLAEGKAVLRKNTAIQIQCVRKVAVHLGYGASISLSVSKLPLKCAVVSLYSFVLQRLKCITGKACNLIQFLLYRRS
jgi:hypothetical protein